MNNNLNLEAPWDQVKEMLKEVHNELTDEDLEYTPDHADELLNRLSEKMHRTPEEIRSWIESVSHNKGIAS